MVQLVVVGRGQFANVTHALFHATVAVCAQLCRDVVVQAPLLVVAAESHELVVAAESHEPSHEVVAVHGALHELLHGVVRGV